MHQITTLYGTFPLKVINPTSEQHTWTEYDLTTYHGKYSRLEWRWWEACNQDRLSLNGLGYEPIIHQVNGYHIGDTTTKAPKAVLCPDIFGQVINPNITKACKWVQDKKDYKAPSLLPYAGKIIRHYNCASYTKMYDNYFDTPEEGWEALKKHNEIIYDTDPVITMPENLLLYFMEEEYQKWRVSDCVKLSTYACTGFHVKASKFLFVTEEEYKEFLNMKLLYDIRFYDKSQLGYILDDLLTMVPEFVRVNQNIILEDEN